LKGFASLSPADVLYSRLGSMTTGCSMAPAATETGRAGCCAGLTPFSEAFAAGRRGGYGRRFWRPMLLLFLRPDGGGGMVVAKVLCLWSAVIEGKLRGCGERADWADTVHWVKERADWKRRRGNFISHTLCLIPQCLRYSIDEERKVRTS
jgi:hypothetical protein